MSSIVRNHLDYVQYLTKNDVEDVLRGKGISAHRAGRVYRRLFLYAKSDKDFEVNCAICGDHVQECEQTDAFRGHQNRVWYDSQYIVSVNSLLEKSTELRRYDGYGCGVKTREAIGLLIDEVMTSVRE